MSLITEVTVDSPSNVAPAIIHLESSEMHDYCTKQLNCVRYKLDSGRQRGMLVEDEDQLRRSMSKASEYCSNFLVLHNRRTGQMQLVQTEQYDLVDSVHTDSNQLVAFNERRALQSLAGKKGLRNSRRTREHTNLTTITSEIDQIMRDYKEPEGSDEQDQQIQLGKQALESIRPPRNPHASTASKLYRVKGIISKALLHEMHDMAKEVLETDPENPKLVLDSYLAGKLRAAQQSTSDISGSMTVAKVCLYLEALGKLMRKKQAHKGGQKPLSSYSKKIDKDIRTLFGHHKSGNPYYSASHEQQKAACYYMALLFALEKTDTLSMSAVSTSMGISSQMIMQCATAIGAKYSIRTKSLKLSLQTVTVSDRPLRPSSFNRRRR